MEENKKLKEEMEKMAKKKFIKTILPKPKKLIIVEDEPENVSLVVEEKDDINKTPYLNEETKNYILENI